MIDTLNFEKLGGILPVVVQDAETLQVLMVGFMNKEALQRTLDERRVTFWSRTRNRLWQKGEISGHFLEVVSLHVDCDNDALLIKVKTHGPVCHTGHYTCFGDEQLLQPGVVLQALEKIIEQRKTTMPEGSYTSKLFSEGVSRIAQKVGEEAVETIIAAMQNDKKRLAEESADLLFHLLVLLRQQSMSLQDITDELRRRMK